jgi:hypothetical protein
LIPLLPVEGDTVSVDTDKLEERVAAILGQIQASVAEYVRTMNEAGALRRREVDEAQRQQDEAISVLKAVQVGAQATAQAHSRLVATLGKEWLGLIERGLSEVAIAQARAAAETAVIRFEGRVNSLAARIDLALTRAEDIANANDRIQRAIAWKTCAVAGTWMIASVAALRILFG